MDQGAFAEDFVDSVLHDNPDPTTIDPDTYDGEEDMNMDTFDFKEEHGIDKYKGGQFMGV